MLGAIVLVDAAKSAAGEDTCGLVGAALINLVALALADQGDLAPPERRRVMLLADEIHTMPGADYEAYLSELAKFGANAVLATQGLGRLDALDKKEEGRALRATIFSNVDGLFTFQVSAEDARYLIPELGGGLEEDDLVELGDYHCYARLSVDGEKLPAFSVHVDPPPSSDPAESEELVAHSARRHGRWRTEVEDDLRAAMTRIELSSGRALPSEEPDPGEQASGKGRPRNSHRPPRKPKPVADQPPLLDPSGGAANSPTA